MDRHTDELAGTLSSAHMARVVKFMRQAGQAVPITPTIPDEATRILRAKLILEEALETIEGLGVEVTWNAVGRGRRIHLGHIQLTPVLPIDLVLVADGCADLRVVTTGTLAACGILNDEELQEAVDQSNLAKFKSPTCPNCGYSAWGSSNKDKERTCNQCGTTTRTEKLGGYRRADGKWVNPHVWQPPDIASIIGLES